MFCKRPLAIIGPIEEAAIRTLAYPTKLLQLAWLDTSKGVSKPEEFTEQAIAWGRAVIAEAFVYSVTKAEALDVCGLNELGE
jgi:hypothetical protein